MVWYGMVIIRPPPSLANGVCSICAMSMVWYNIFRCTPSSTHQEQQAAPLQPQADCLKSGRMLQVEKGVNLTILRLLPPSRISTPLAQHPITESEKHQPLQSKLSPTIPWARRHQTNVSVPFTSDTNIHWSIQWLIQWLM